MLNSSALITVLMFAALISAFLVPAVIYICREKMEKRKKREYKEKYVTEFSVKDKKFGELTFENDSYTACLTLKDGDILNIPFGKYSGFEINIEIDTVNADNEEAVIRNLLYDLANVYNNHKKILNDIYHEVLDMCGGCGEADSKGNTIDFDYVKRNFVLYCIECKFYRGENGIALIGDIRDEELFGDHSVIAGIDCKTNEVNCNIG